MTAEAREGPAAPAVEAEGRGGGEDVRAFWGAG